MGIISIIIPVYNSSKYLARCLNSVLGQSFCDLEVILVDDGSTDDSGLICDQYALKDKRVRVVHQQNQGQSAARNHGVNIAFGEWIMFVDSDDMVHPKIVERLYQAVLSYPNIGMAVCRRIEDAEVPKSFFTNITAETSVVSSSESTSLNFYKDGQYYWTIWAKLIRKDIILKHPFTVGKYYEDNAVVCKWIYTAKKIAVVPQELYFYQINPEGTTKGKITHKYFDFLWAMEEQIQFYDLIGYSKMCQEALRLYFGSYEDRMDKTAYFTNKKRIRRKITGDAFRVWKRYKGKYTSVQNEWKHILLVALPVVLQVRGMMK